MKKLFTILTLSTVLFSCNTNPKKDKETKNTTEKLTKIDSVDVKQVVLSMHDAVMTNDLSDSLTFNQWTDFFTSDFLYMQSEGKPAIKMGKIGFKDMREAFKSIKISYDEIIIDYVDSSCDLAYVSYHYKAIATTIKTNESQDISSSALLILKKNDAAEWKIAYLVFN
ncbi:MAG: ketosteroid isomerase-like protein [Sediminicola sp.]|jgi:ketosteroid isomerase-like protein